jgi:hypothetical protein
LDQSIAFFDSQLWSSVRLKSDGACPAPKP